MLYQQQRTTESIRPLYSIQKNQKSLFLSSSYNSNNRHPIVCNTTDERRRKKKLSTASDQRGSLCAVCVIFYSAPSPPTYPINPLPQPPTAASSPSWTCSSRRRAVRKGQRTTHRLFNPQHKSLARSQSTQGVVTYPLPSFKPTQSFNISSFASCDTHSLSFLLTLRLPGVFLFFFIAFFVHACVCVCVPSITLTR